MVWFVDPLLQDIEYGAVPPVIVKEIAPSLVNGVYELVTEHSTPIGNKVIIWQELPDNTGIYNLIKYIRNRMYILRDR
jgi:hypothetical protein